MLYSDPPGTPWGNMALDAWTLERAEALGTPVLRLYTWDRPTLSVGRAQKLSREIDLEACHAEGVTLVRRSTGGRAVLHGSDLTYAVAAPTNLPHFQGGILPVYREISRVFEVFFRKLGIEPEVKAYTGRDRAEQASAICFATPSAFEIMVQGRKLLGSAQRLQARALLQHGSLPLVPQQHLLARLFLGATPRGVAESMTDLTTLGILPARDEAALRDDLVRAFEDVLGAEFQEQRRTPADLERIAVLESAFPPLGKEELPKPDSAAGRTPKPGPTLGGLP